ncbi:MAG: hypothetical protein ACYSWP_10230, partial [Planctomycetota bacterium]
MEKTYKKFDGHALLKMSFMAFLAIVATTIYFTVCYAGYDEWTDIDDVTINNPEDSEVWLIQSKHTLTCTTSNDTDCNLDTGLTEPDSVTHYWTTSSGGDEFEDNDNVGTSVTYFCPNASGSVTITVHADDDHSESSNTA